MVKMNSCFGIGTNSPSAKLHIVGNIVSCSIEIISRISEETGETLYDYYDWGDLVKTMTRKEYYRDFLLMPDQENTDDLFELIIDSGSGNVGIGSFTLVQ